MTTSKRVLGIGSALVDILVQGDDALVAACGVPKGGMTLTDPDTMTAALARIQGEARRVPGGSACNTAIGVSRLGGVSRFIGKYGPDPAGQVFQQELVRNGVEPCLLSAASPTGQVLSIITPDGQRSMLTCLSAAAELGPDDLNPEWFADVAVVHIEGYLSFQPDLLMRALTLAKAAGARVSFDLASYTVVEAAGPLLNQVVDQFVDILLANEDEGRAFTGLTQETDMLDLLARRAPLASLKVGPRGSWIAQGEDRHFSPPAATGAVQDTTGAGDLWAAGLLYGLVHGFPMDHCGRLAAACGWEVCQVLGAHIPDEGWQRIKEMMNGAIGAG